ncbi:hypothetical protein D3C79_701810 [compost metagenome]
MQGQLGEFLIGQGQRTGKFGGPGFQASIQHRGQQGRGQHRQGGNQHQVIQAVAAQAITQGAAVTAFREVRRGHAGVMHADDRHAHDDRRAATNLPHVQGLLAQAEGDPQGRRRSADGDQQRGAEQRRVVVDARRHAQRGHAGVMHAADAGAHDQCAKTQLQPGQGRLADQPQGKARRQPGDQQRQQSQGNVIAQLDRQAQGEHADKVHRPDPGAHGQRPAYHPQVHRAPFGGGDPAGQVKGGIRSKDGHTQRNQYQRRRVTTDQHEAFHNP